MLGRFKGSVLAAAIFSAVAASQARATFTYDLRFADGSHTKDITNDPTGTQYQLQLWAQITYSTSASNQIWAGQFVNVEDTAKVGTGAITGSTMVGVPDSTLFSTNAGLAGDFNSDGVQDWGSTNTATTTGWMQYVASNGIALGTQTYAGYQGGTAVAGVSEAASIPNTWEVLIGTFTITTTGKGSAGGSTTFNVASIPATVKTGQFSSLSGLSYVQDASSTQKTPSSTSGTIGTGATFVISAIPEPASMGVLALGGLALLARRRKRA